MGLRAGVRLLLPLVLAGLLQLPPPARAQQAYVLEVEILPPESDADDSAGEVASRLASAVADTSNALHDSEYLTFDLTQEVRIERTLVEPAVDVESDGDVRVAAASDIDLVAGGSLHGTFVDEVDVLAGGAQVRTVDGGVELTSGGAADFRAGGDAAVFASGALQAAAASAAAQLGGDMEATVGGAASASVAADIAVAAGGSAGLSARDNAWVSGGNVMVDAAAGLRASASMAELTGSEQVRVASRGSAVELSGEGEVEYVGYVWRSSRSFQSFQNSVPRIEGVVEVIVHARAADEAQVVTIGGTTLHMDLGVADATTQAFTTTRVWSSEVGTGSYSLDGLHVRMSEQTVDLIRLSSEEEAAFQGWGEVVFYFGRVVGVGTVTVAASNALEAVAGQLVSVAAEALRIQPGYLFVTIPIYLFF